MGHYNEFYEAEDQKRSAEDRSRKQVTVDRLEEALRYLAGRASREEALAITHIETAILWLRK